MFLNWCSYIENIHIYKCKYHQLSCSCVVFGVCVGEGDIKEKSITVCDCLQQKSKVLIMFSVLIHDFMIYMNCYYGNQNDFMCYIL